MDKEIRDKYSVMELKSERKESALSSFISGTANVASGIAKTAAVLGGGYFALKKGSKHLTKITSDFLESSGGIETTKKVNSVIDEITAFSRSLDDTAKTTGYKRIFTGKADEEIKSNLTKHLVSVQAAKGRAIGSTQTGLEKALTSIPMVERDVMNASIQNIRSEEIMKDVTRKFGKDSAEKRMMDNFLAKHQRTRVGQRVLDGDMKPQERLKMLNNILKSGGFNKEMLAKGRNTYTNSVVGLSDILNKHTLTDEYRKKIDVQVNTRYTKLMDKYYQSLVNTVTKGDSAKTQFVDSVLNPDSIGLKRLTVGQAKDLNLLDDFGMSKSYAYIDEAKKITRKHVNPQEKINDIIDKSPGLKDAFLDPLIFLNKNNQVVDLRNVYNVPSGMVNAFSEHTKIPFLNFNPVKMIRDAIIPGNLNAPNAELLKKGTVNPLIDGTESLLKDHFYFNGQLVNQAGDSVGLGYLYKSSEGITRRAVKTMMDNTMPEYGNPLSKLYDIGHQEETSVFGKAGSVVTKFFDPKWERNIVEGLKGDSVKSMSFVQDSFGTLYNRVYNSAGPLSNDILDDLRPQMQNFMTDQEMDEMMFGSRDEAVMNTINNLINKHEVDNVPLLHYQQLKNLRGEYLEDSDKFINYERIVKTKQEMVSINEVDSVTPSVYDKTTKLDDARKLLHSEILYQVENSSILAGGEKFDIMDYFSNVDSLSVEDIESVRNVNALKEMQKWGGSNYTYGSELDRKGLEATLYNFQEQTGAAKDIEQIVKEANGLFRTGPESIEDGVFQGSDWIYVNKSKAFDYKNVLGNINKNLEQGENMTYSILNGMGVSSRDMANELGFGGANRAGRNNLQDISRASIGSYHYLFRLNDMLSNFGVGLSNTNMGSTQDIAFNMLARRVALPTATLGYMAYLNDEAGQMTGEKPTQTAARTYSNMTLGSAMIKDITGITAMGKHLQKIMPGSELLDDNPFGMAAQAVTAGFIGDNRSAKELREYYENGYEAVRKGRYWSIGSSTPFYGERIKYWQPNWYRRAMTDPYYTDTYYGEGMERWENSLLPNLRNPLGALNPGAWDHYDEKHEDDRPYPIKQTKLANIPVVGGVLDDTVGRVIMPFRKRPGLEKSHREYLAEINMMHEYNANINSSANYLYITPGGRTEQVSFDPGTGGGLVGSTLAQGLDTQMPQKGGVGIASAGTGATGVVASGFEVSLDDQVGVLPGMSQGGSAVANRQQLAAINQQMTQGGAIINRKKLQAPNLRVINSLKDSYITDRLDAATNPNDPMYRLGRTYYSMAEIGGMWGFFANSLGGDSLVPNLTLESSVNMMGMGERFWDSELGGLGGDMSELYRRFMPKWNRGEKFYNPIRNTMPGWLPGPEYFLDLRHGDPYAKVPKGELRLPGASYEAINHLHSDPYFGKYGAVDRMKILADVAPYSEQYAYYASLTSRMKEQGMIDEEAYGEVKQAKDRVKQQKEKYNFYDYKFKYADVKNDTVTIKEWIDENTFTTVENPGTAMRLAGLGRLRKMDESDKANEIRGVLQDKLAPGEKIRVGYSKDPLKRYNSDTMQTMDVVVYGGLQGTINKEIASIAERKILGFGDESPIEVKWDSKDAVDVKALYNNADINTGKRWEAFAHLNTPLHTKFLQVRSPVEMYERREIYGKSWQSWNNPIRDWVVPTLETWWNTNPLIATGLGAGVGYLFGNRRAKLITTMIGATLGGLGSSTRAISEGFGRVFDSNAQYIPKRRKEERDINEYFDFLEYVKYKGLYEKARNLAISEDGIDPEELMNAINSRGDTLSTVQKNFEKVKKWYKTRGSNKDEVKDINASLNQIQAERLLAQAGPTTLRALQYKKKFESTLFGADPHGDMMDIYQALPEKDRPFYKEFVDAPPEEREKILRLVPKNQRRFYQAAWGMEVDEKPAIEQMAAKYNVPGAGWNGWDPKYSVDEMKLKFLDKKGKELTEYGYWKDDLQSVQAGTPAIMAIKGGTPLDLAQVYKAIQGLGVSDAQIRMDIQQVDPRNREQNMSPYEISMQLDYDRRSDISKFINDNVNSLFN